MNVNVWLAIREDDHNELNNLRGAEQSGISDVVRNFVNGQLDPDVVQNLYLTRTQGPNVWHLWSIILDDADGPFNQQINDFRQQYPGCQVLGVWKVDGAMLGCELVLTDVPNPAYTGQPYMIPNPAYQPDPELDDWDPRTEIRNPLWVPEFLTERSQSGTPAYDPPTFLLSFMPPVWNGDDPPTYSPATELTDVNLPAGWATRVFI